MFKQLFRRHQQLGSFTVKQLPSADSGPSHCMARFYNRHIDSGRKDYSRLFRGDAIVIEHPVTGRKIVRYAAGVNPSEFSLKKSEMAIDYDGYDALGIKLREEHDLNVRRAYLYELLKFHFNHPDKIHKSSVRFFVIGTVVSVFCTFISL